MAAVISNFGALPHFTPAPAPTTNYNTLPSLRQASEEFKKLDAIKSVVGPIRDLFLKHKVNKQFGIVLLHKHFPIQPTKRLVDYRNISSPWDVSHDTQAVTTKYNGFIVPRSFRFLEEKLVPFEFEFSDLNSPSEIDGAFSAKLSSLLNQLGLDHVLGLRTLDTHDSELTVEVTEGNANIMIKRGIVSDDELIQAVWIFGKDEDDACHCKEFCRVLGGEHVESNHSCG
ncbi:hypothetical protein CC78DRAFT_607690 [Lojkania enalia]|uniref:Uncharacterized protein n=1 Tax=Lojkania enalia TaxID=147567 RepID=A0A9P4K2N6_9PLEO|nr:hypothetical protein CC78DRAFT_607690 [Didymosphaeria enalia]